MKIPAKSKCDWPDCPAIEPNNLNVIVVSNRDGGKQYDFCDEHFIEVRDVLPEFMRLATVEEQSIEEAARAAERLAAEDAKAAAELAAAEE